MTRAGRGLPTVPVRLPPPGPRASCLEQCSSRTRRGQTNLSCSLDHVTTLIRSDSGAFSLNSHTFLFLESQTHSECGHKRASPGCCGLCGSLLGLLGFHGNAMVNRHMQILVYVEAVLRFQADTRILPHFQLKEHGKPLLADLQKRYYRLGK